MDTMTVILSVGAALGGSALGAAVSLMLLRKRTRLHVKRSEASYMQAMKELRQVHAMSIRVAEKQHQQAAHAAQVERDHLQARINEMATELLDAREAINNLLCANDHAIAAADRHSFAPTEPMGRAA